MFACFLMLLSCDLYAPIYISYRITATNRYEYVSTYAYTTTTTIDITNDNTDQQDQQHQPGSTVHITDKLHLFFILTINNAALSNTYSHSL